MAEKKTIIDTVTIIEPGETQKGKKFIKVKTEDDVYFVWNIPAFNELGIHEGDKVRITYTGENFKQVESIEKVESEEKPKEEQKQQQKQENGLTAKDIAIAKMSVLQSLSRLLAEEKSLNFYQKLEEIRNVAPIFENWVLGRNDLNDLEGILPKDKK